MGSRALAAAVDSGRTGAPWLGGGIAATLARSLGVTRVARVTGLDRTGIEVACAVRPGGHVLQVCNGKGLDFARAEAGALLETAELWAAEHVPLEALLFGRRCDLPSAWDASALGSAGALVAPELWSAQTRCAWVRARELRSNAEILLPAQAVYCPPPGGPLLGPAVTRWTSNGMGAHPRRARALRHALLEAIERDQLARALPEGFTRAAVRTRMIDLASLPEHLRAFTLRIESRGFRLHLFDLSGRMAGALPVAAALLVDLEQGPIPLTAGYACGEEPEEALWGALLEAAQSRLTDIHGAREDVAQPAPDLTGLIAACLAARPARRFEELRAGALGSLRGPVAVVDLPAPVHVIKVVIPGFRVSELL